MTRTFRLAVLAVLAVLAALCVVPALSAQAPGGLQLSIGPAYRIRTASSALSARSGMEGVAAGLDWDHHLAGRLGLVAGVGAFWGTRASGQLIVSPCLPEGPCAPPNPAPDAVVSGSLYDLRLGVSLAGSRFRAYLGGVVGHSPDGVQSAGAGGFASLWVAPWSAKRRLSLGLTAQLLTPAPGHTRAIISPRLGVRF